MGVGCRDLAAEEALRVVYKLAQVRGADRVCASAHVHNRHSVKRTRHLCQCRQGGPRHTLAPALCSAFKSMQWQESKRATRTESPHGQHVHGVHIGVGPSNGGFVQEGLHRLAQLLVLTRCTGVACATRTTSERTLQGADHGALESLTRFEGHVHAHCPSLHKQSTNS
jgi:hypothetical protein